ncbi:MAG: radical SAM protein [Desulfobacteraceae bacterium]|nr:radical SAM protein [Desulfobacteraceae bacterium]
MIENENIASVNLPDSDLVKKLQRTKTPVSINFELTARCNNNCRHCYINLPENNTDAESLELDINEIEDLADQAVNNGVLWCLLTGGEPLLRDDFSEIYLMLRRKGLLVSVFTNACLINETHVKLFKKYKPRELEVTVYGITEKTYEKVSGIKGSYKLFKNGLDRLLTNDIPVSLKAMAIHSNIHEIENIADFCSKHSKKKFKFDPFLHKRYDGDEKRNKKILSERLNKDEIVKIEQNNFARKNALIKSCDQLIFYQDIDASGRVFTCGVLKNGFEISYDGKLRLCPALLHPDYVYSLRIFSLMDAYRKIAENIIKARSYNEDFLNKCNKCKIINLCYFCPANSFLETGKLDTPIDTFCKNAHARQKAILEWKKSSSLS